MKGSLKQIIMLAILNRYILILFNFILCAIIVSIVMEFITLVRTPENDIKEMVEMCNGIAIILYGYGVALESRAPLMRYLKLYPDFATPLQTGVDELCHKYGIFILLLALAQEVLVHLVTIPNRVLNTAGKEFYIFSICITVLMFVSFLLLRLTVMAVLPARLIAAYGKEQTSTVDR
ncbi:MAG: hypothetical protein Q8O28_01320 [Smithellaceae bacterium]|nr:hypothetical protein [Smithellaceae bacterium]